MLKLRHSHFRDNTGFTKDLSESSQQSQSLVPSERMTRGISSFQGTSSQCKQFQVQFQAPETQFKSLSSMDSELPGSPGDPSRARDQSVGCCFDNREKKSRKKDERRPLPLRAALDSPVSTGRGKQTSGGTHTLFVFGKAQRPNRVGAASPQPQWELVPFGICVFLIEPIDALFCLPVCFACEQTAGFRQNKSTRKLSASAVP